MFNLINSTIYDSPSCPKCEAFTKNSMCVQIRQNTHTLTVFYNAGISINKCMNDATTFKVWTLQFGGCFTCKNVSGYSHFLNGKTVNVWCYRGYSSRKKDL